MLMRIGAEFSSCAILLGYGSQGSARIEPNTFDFDVELVEINEPTN